MKRIEQALRSLITSKALTDEQREEVLGLLAGTRTGKIAPAHAGFSPAEQQLVTHYRALGQNRRHLATRFLQELASVERFEQKKGGA